MNRISARSTPAVHIGRSIPFMSTRIRTRSDGTAYSQVRYRINGKQSSVSFDDHAEALAFDRLITKVGPAKALQITRITIAHDDAMTVLRSDVATGKFRVRPPDTGALPPGVGPQAELGSSRTITTSPTNLDGLL